MSFGNSCKLTAGPDKLA